MTKTELQSALAEEDLLTLEFPAHRHPEHKKRTATRSIWRNFTVTNAYRKIRDAGAGMVSGGSELGDAIYRKVSQAGRMASNSRAAGSGVAGRFR